MLSKHIRTHIPKFSSVFVHSPRSAMINFRPGNTSISPCHATLTSNPNGSRAQTRAPEESDLKPIPPSRGSCTGPPPRAAAERPGDTRGHETEAAAVDGRPAVSRTPTRHLPLRKPRKRPKAAAASDATSSPGGLRAAGTSVKASQSPWVWSKPLKRP